MSSSDPPTDSLPPGLVLYQLGIGHYVSRALALAVTLGVADLLADGPRSAEELARSTETHAPALRRVLRLLASVGVLGEEANGSFSLTAMGELLREDVPGSMKAAVSVFAGVRIQDSWRELEFCVRTGEPAFKKDDPDADPFTAMAQDPGAAATFDEAMAAFTSQTALAVAACYDFSGFETLMDVGGGNGALLFGILDANPQLKGIVLEQPHVAERARKEIAKRGLDDRMEAIGGSFFEEIPKRADAIVLKHVIHDWNDEKATSILQRCRAALPAGGTLLLVEGVYPRRIDTSLESRGAAANDVNMLVVAGGRQRSEDEFRELYTAAGFELTRVVPTPARVAVIEGTPANR
jgi:SAM-dependent methyltransferase